MFRRSVLIIALVFCLPALWQTLVVQSLTWEGLGIRFLIALPIAAVLVSLVRIAFHTDDYDEDEVGEARGSVGGVDRMSED